ncbi:hypothetical protein NXZ77_08925 [Lysinibacillus boronitolerans]|uniref:Lipoprotein n=1 Tax=Lysinibacillus boronitolerans JCM 21713 = 10a = NBRC 103108 TaxID=1294264 RepID=A0ABR4Y685_9BACI|nr:hypothetical protein [Lysinibacillus boronitolerans]KGR89188.1 hypothetical protein CD31_01060 [Lysinibacillus boronitolerans JCM 21713 = 10a = NBRC 103108]MCS1391692.1 hypothetical protein [Lysinibacillus boronitolerans]
MRKIIVFSLFFTLVLLSGCNENEKLSNPVFNWDGNNYFVTNEPINKIELEEKIGEIVLQTKKLPTKHQEGYRLSEGTNLYKIKNMEITNNIDSVIAVEINGEYKIARILNEIK